MAKQFLIIGLLLMPWLTHAEVLSMPATQGATSEASSPLPTRGQTMAAVQKRFGEPAKRHSTVGGDAPKHPPITRWDYADFYVVFEHDRVIDAVRPEAPAQLYHTDQLKPAG